MSLQQKKKKERRIYILEIIKLKRLRVLGKIILNLIVFFFIFSNVSFCLGDEIVSPKSLEDGNVYSVNPTTYIRTGAGKDNVIQGLALDEKSNALYTLHVTGKPEMGTLNRFKINQKSTISTDAIQLPSGFIGHQGISVDPSSGDIYASGGTSIKNKGWYVVRFCFSENEKPKKIFIIKTFGDGYKKTTSSMPVLTPDGKNLLVRGNKNNINVIRIFNMKILKSNISDISTSFIDEWNISKDLTNNHYDLQAITTDGKRVFILSGGENSLPKRLFIYDMKGNLIQRLDNITLGFTQARLSGTEAHWEPEGISYMNSSKSLLVAFAIGDFKARQAIVFIIPLIKQ